MENFVQNFLQVVDKVAHGSAGLLCATWIRLYGHENEDKFLIHMETFFTTFLKSISNDNLEMESKLKTRLENLIKRKERIEGQLKEKISLPVFVNKPLYLAVKEASKVIEVFNKKYLERWEEVDQLKSEGNALCQELEETPSNLLKTSEELPSEEETKELRRYLNHLRELKGKRSEKIRKHQREIRILIDVLGSAKLESFEQIGSECSLSNIEKLENMAFKLQEVRAEMVTEIEGLFDRLQVLWKELKFSEDHQDLFSYDSASYDKTVLEQLRRELERCEKLKMERLPELIENLRSEIIDFSQKCMKGETFRHQSTAFQASVYDDRMLQHSQLEVMQLKSFFDQNHQLFKMISLRDELRLELKDLNDKQMSKTKRLNNRGGVLLQEEQKRSGLERELIKTEIALCKAVDSFQATNKFPLLIFDEVVQVDRTAQSRLTMKRQASLKDLRLKKPLGDRTNI